MIEAVFISDVHLHPEDKAIQKRFEDFLHWAKGNVKSIYILGDLFHVWAGDDSMNAWSRSIAAQLKHVTEQGIRVFYMHGNRDFLIGTGFSQQAGWTLIPDPTIIELGGSPVLLSHGDRYCTQDKAHQRLRILTRNRVFRSLFLALPLSLRQKIVNTVRTMSSQGYQKKPMELMDVVPDAVIQHVRACNTSILVHGHTHRPGVSTYGDNTQIMTRYVLSDWDDIPTMLCYNGTQGFDLRLFDFNGG